MVRTWMAGTRVKYPMRMMHSSVAMFFMMDQLSLLRPGQGRRTIGLLVGWKDGWMEGRGRSIRAATGCCGLTLRDAEFHLQVHGCRHHRLCEDQDVLQSNDDHQVGEDLPGNRKQDSHLGLCIYFEGGHGQKNIIIVWKLADLGRGKNGFVL